MPKITVNGVVRDMTPDEEKELNVRIEKDKEERIAYEKVKYKDERKMEYPEIGDQLDDLFKQGVFSKEMTAKIQQVKTDHPKPE
tara:strand:+ start:720 stop:971 length:252 start_codon:yes stop_codon:yes gene_type:complete